MSLPILQIPNAVVFFADILGFKSTLYSDPVRLQSMLSKFQLFSHHIQASNPIVNGFAIMDSIILWVDLAVPNALGQLLASVNYILWQSFASPPHIQIRSGIATGQLTIGRITIGAGRYHSSIFYGDAYQEAYKLSSKGGIGMRCLVTHSASTQIEAIQTGCIRSRGSDEYEYLWPCASARDASGDAAYLLNEVTLTTPCGKAILNNADSLALTLIWCADKKVRRDAVQWAIANHANVPALKEQLRSDMNALDKVRLWFSGL